MVLPGRDIGEPHVRRNSEDFALVLDCFNRVGYDVDIADTAREFGITPPRLDQWASMQRA